MIPLKASLSQDSQKGASQTTSPLLLPEVLMQPSLVPSEAPDASAWLAQIRTQTSSALEKREV